MDIVIGQGKVPPNDKETTRCAELCGEIMVVCKKWAEGQTKPGHRLKAQICRTSAKWRRHGWVGSRRTAATPGLVGALVG